MMSELVGLVLVELKADRFDVAERGTQVRGVGRRAEQDHNRGTDASPDRLQQRKEMEHVLILGPAAWGLDTGRPGGHTAGRQFALFRARVRTGRCPDSSRPMTR